MCVDFSVHAVCVVIIRSQLVSLILQASRRKETGSEGEAEGKGAVQETENPVFAGEGGKNK